MRATIFVTNEAPCFYWIIRIWEGEYHIVTLESEVMFPTKEESLADGVKFAKQLHLELEVE